MNSGKIKSVFIFIVLTGVLFYFGHLLAREPMFSIEDTEQSARFLDAVAVLNDIQFDLDFVNSLGDTAIKTDVYIRPLSPSDAGRDNPFRKSNPSALFERPQDVFSGQDQIRSIQEELPPPASSEILAELTEEERLFIESQNIVVPPAEEQSVVPLAEDPVVVVPEEGEIQIEESPDPPSATLTR